jgi:hypothetical protein
MGSWTRSVQQIVAWLAIGALLAWPDRPDGADLPQAADTRGTSGAAAVVVPADGEWPRRYVGADRAMVVVYEPQVASWEQQKLLSLYAAVAYTAPGADTPLLGTVMAEADTRVSVEERLVDFSSFRILQSNFPQAPKDQAAAAVAALKANMPLGERVLTLDRVLAYVDSSVIRARNVDGVKADPPAIFYSTRPALMVNVDGDPVWSPIQGNELRYAVNTNWDLFEHPPSKTLYLRHDQQWLQAQKIGGPWTAARTLPPSFGRLPADDNWKDVRAAIPARAASTVPTVFVSTAPAELILLRGAPQYEPVPGTKLLWVRNTDADVFRLGANGTLYYLVSGRWFSAPGANGPWTFATPSLPEDFTRIPLEHERSRVLASVPGTTQAAEAVLLAQVPQTARVSKKEVKAPDVAYQGVPQFTPVVSTNASRAVNTDKDVIKVGERYFLCYQGVWFVSPTPDGPWEVTGSIPPEVYQIPVSDPAHHVTYVTVESEDDEWVEFAAEAAYAGLMTAWGVSMWGTGWYYPPYVWYGGSFPAYIPRYPTYGYGAWYNPWTGSYGRAVTAYGPYGGAGIGARYNPRTGTYARGAVAYGPGGARGVAGAYNPRTGTYATTRQGANVYGSWGATGVRRGDDWAATARVTSRATGNTTRVTRTDEGAVATRGTPGDRSFVGQTGGDEVFAGRDGNVYRKDGDSWQKYENGSWNSAERARSDGDRTPSTRPESTTIGQLDRDLSARRDGGQRSRDAATIRSGGGGSRSGSYRPSGGGMRMGGGRRR